MCSESIGEEIQEGTLEEKPAEQVQQQKQAAAREKPISESESEPTQIESDSEGVMMRSLTHRRRNKGLTTVVHFANTILSLQVGGGVEGGGCKGITATELQ